MFQVIWKHYEVWSHTWLSFGHDCKLTICFTLSAKWGQTVPHELLSLEKLNIQKQCSLLLFFNPLSPHVVISCFLFYRSTKRNRSQANFTFVTILTCFLTVTLESIVEIKSHSQHFPSNINVLKSSVDLLVRNIHIAFFTKTESYLAIVWHRPSLLWLDMHLAVWSNPVDPSSHTSS